MDQFESESFDYIITVCDRVRDICPVFRGDPVQIHWSFPDPVVVEDPEQQLAAFRRTATELQTRVRSLPAVAPS
jgi:protein-tyrosine-phosphatase